jgi:hypothetical protein
MALKGGGIHKRKQTFTQTHYAIAVPFSDGTPRAQTPALSKYLDKVFEFVNDGDLEPAEQDECRRRRQQRPRVNRIA